MPPIYETGARLAKPGLRLPSPAAISPPATPPAQIGVRPHAPPCRSPFAGPICVRLRGRIGSLGPGAPRPSRRQSADALYGGFMGIRIAEADHERAVGYFN